MGKMEKKMDRGRAAETPRTFLDVTAQTSSLLRRQQMSRVQQKCEGDASHSEQSPVQLHLHIEPHLQISRGWVLTSVIKMEISPHD